MSVSSVAFLGIYGHPQNDVLRKGLRERGIDVIEATVQTRDFSEAWADKRPPLLTMRSTMNYFGRYPAWLFPLLVLGTLLIHALATWVALVREWRAVSQTDAIIVPHMGDTSVLFVAPLAKLLGVPVVYCSHNGMYLTLITNRELYGLESIAARLVFWLDKACHRLSDSVVVFSDASAEEFVDLYGLARERYETIYISVREEDFQLEDERDTDIDCDVLYWGNFHPHHGPEVMVEAAQLVPEASFVLAGQSEKRQPVIEYAEERSVENVAFPGFLSEAELLAHIETADVVLGPVADNPQTRFTIGTKVAEAAFREKAIVVGRQPAIEEVFDHQESAFLVEPGSAAAVAEGVRRLRSDPGLRECCETGAGTVYQDSFSPETAAERFEYILTEFQATTS